MQSSNSPDDLTDLPVSCSLCLVQEGVIGTGWVWAFSPTRCLVQSPLSASPGMKVILFLHLPRTARTRIEGVVTWARESEFGIQLLPHAVSLHNERVTL